MTPGALSQWIREQGRAVGFDRVGIAPATDLPELHFFPEWKQRGYAGELNYLHEPKREDVRKLFPQARSVICCALAYNTPLPYSTQVPPDPERGWVSRYAWGDDYHDIVAAKLEQLRAAIRHQVGNGLALSQGEGFIAKLYVDTGPVLERVYGKYAGLGWTAKNTCLLDAELGSWFFVGVLVTNLALEPDQPLPDGCGACTLCLEACPTGALDPARPYVMDARRCISYLTIELRGSIPEELRAPLGRHVFGCDICQDVCPYNHKPWLTQVRAFEPRCAETRNSKIENRGSSNTAYAPSPVAAAAGKESLFHPRLEWLAALGENEFREVFRHSAIKRTKWRGLIRNILVAMGNSANSYFRPILEKFAFHVDSLLAEHARWALGRLESLSEAKQETRP